MGRGNRQTGASQAKKLQGLRTGGSTRASAAIRLKTEGWWGIQVVSPVNFCKGNPHVVARYTNAHFSLLPSLETCSLQSSAETPASFLEAKDIAKYS